LLEKILKLSSQSCRIVALQDALEHIIFLKVFVSRTAFKDTNNGALIRENAS